MNRLLVSLTLAVGLMTFEVGCSGGGGNNGGVDDPSITPPPPAPVANLNPVGAWYGTSSEGRSVWGIMRADGRYWFLYSAIGDPSLLAGGMQGYGVVQGDEFASFDIFEYSTDAVNVQFGTLTGQIVERQSLSMTLVRLSGERFTFNLTYQPQIQSSGPDITQAAGTYLGSTAGSVRSPGMLQVRAAPLENVTVDATSAGAPAWPVWQITVCPGMDGRIPSPPSFLNPALEGMGHVYDFSIVYSCSRPFVFTLYGIAMFDPTTNTLMLFAKTPQQSSDGRHVFIYRGMKQ